MKHYWIAYGFFTALISPAAAQDDGAASATIRQVEKGAEQVLHEGFYSTDVLVRTCFILMGLFVLAATAVVITLFVTRTRSKHKARRRAALKERYELLLTGIIFNDEAEMQSGAWKQQVEKLIRHFRKNYLRSEFNKSVLCEQLLVLHRNFSGSSAVVLRNLYLELGFDKRALRHLKRRSWSRKAQAVRELTQMQIIHAKAPISRLLRHSNMMLRLEAQTAMLTLEENDPFSFLDDTGLLSEWQQVNLEHTMKKMDHARIPDFSRWLSSPSPSVVTFSIRMIVLQNQFEGSEKLLALLASPDPLIVKETVIAIGEMGLQEAEAALIALYAEVNEDIKQQVLLTLGKIGGNNAFDFICGKLHDPDFGLAFAAARGLHFSGSEGDSILDGMTVGSRPESRIARHVLDNRI